MERARAAQLARLAARALLILAAALAAALPDAPVLQAALRRPAARAALAAEPVVAEPEQVDGAVEQPAEAGLGARPA